MVTDTDVSAAEHTVAAWITANAISDHAFDGVALIDGLNERQQHAIARVAIGTALKLRPGWCAYRCACALLKERAG